MIKLIRDGQDPKKAATFMAPLFKNPTGHIVYMIKGESTDFVAKAIGQNDEALDVMFDYESSAPHNVDVIDEESPAVTLEAILQGEAMITVKVVDRGIRVKFPVRSQKPVDSVVIAGDKDRLIGIGEKIPLGAAASDDDGIAVHGVMIAFDSDDPDIASVKPVKDSPGSAIVEGKSAGSTKIWARSRGKDASINVTVYAIEGTERRLRVTDKSALPYMADYTAKDGDTAASLDPATLTLSVTLEFKTVDEDGEDTWKPVVGDDDNDGDLAMVKFTSLTPSVISLTSGTGDAMKNYVMDAVTDVGVGTVNITVTNVKKTGSAVIRVDEQYSKPIFLQVTIE